MEGASLCSCRNIFRVVGKVVILRIKSLRKGFTEKEFVSIVF